MRARQCRDAKWEPTGKGELRERAGEARVEEGGESDQAYDAPRTKVKGAQDARAGSSRGLLLDVCAEPAQPLEQALAARGAARVHEPRSVPHPVQTQLLCHFGW